MKRHVLLGAAALTLPAAALAGPPFLTDDPEPTELGHWEIYAPLVEAEGVGYDYEGSVGAELNYGLAKDVQLTVGMAGVCNRSAGRSRCRRGDLEASVKYRFYHDETSGVQVAAFPGITLPTGSAATSAGRPTALLPVGHKRTSGLGLCLAAAALPSTQARGTGTSGREGWPLSARSGDRLTVGLEADRDGPSEGGGHCATSLGSGAIYDFPGSFRLLASGGPTFRKGERASFHAFLALGIDY